MFAVRPVLRHFLLWIALAPLFLIEMGALKTFLQLLDLQAGRGTVVVVAAVTDRRRGPQGEEVRYSFSVPGRSERYHAVDLTRWSNLWIPLGPEAGQRARAEDTIEVVYLRDNPWVNQAVGRRGYPLGDSFLTWLFFLVIDLLWLAESFVILRNYAYCQVAVERRQPQRLRFWESRRVRTELGFEA
ncbi:MAG TPA: hypothetical protein VFS21_36950 [Roseiflexaceae bacterium]|nr:hypothetical protein [Roseiflexaceae bacterium]